MQVSLIRTTIGMLLRITVLCCALATIGASPTTLLPPPLRFAQEPPPFFYVNDKVVNVVPCAAEASSAADVRWFTEEVDSAGRSTWVNLTTCANSKSLTIVGNKYGRKTCGVKAEDRWLSSPQQVFCALIFAGYIRLSRPVLLIRVADVAKPVVSLVSQQVYESGVLHLRCATDYNRRALLQYFWSVDGIPVKNSAIGKSQHFACLIEQVYLPA